MSSALPVGRAALVIGHPGHELRVHRWLELARPTVFVLTDGSGHGQPGRLASTDRIVRGAGASAGLIFGRLTDRMLYDMLVRGEVGAWIEMASELAGHLLRLEIDYVVADAAEGFNPTHDLSRYVVDAAIARVSRESKRELPAFEFDLDAAPDADHAPPGQGSFHIGLDEEALERKIESALDYVEMREEVAALLARFGRRAFALEAFRPSRSGSARWLNELPEYERYGQRRVASGLYSTVITYGTHLAPVQAALSAWSRG